MEEIEKKFPDFDEWLENYEEPEISYIAAIDVNTGGIKAVGPRGSLESKKFKKIIDIPTDIAIKIISGEISITKVFVDLSSGEYEITETKNLHKIDDVLHRIVERKWAEIEVPDLALTYDSSQQELHIELSEEFGGTYKLPADIKPVPRKMFWNGETNLDFILTDYNDPHVIHDSISIKLFELENNKKSIKINAPKKFSIYTRRIFKKYILEVL